MVWVQLLVALAINILAYLIAPKPKTPKPPAAQDLENPTAEAGRPIPVAFGEITIKGGNVLWYGNKRIRTIKVRV
jgi:hypothetical protein